MANAWDFSNVWIERYAISKYPTFRWLLQEEGDVSEYVTSSCVNVKALIVQNLNHLEGLEVGILADGVRLPNQTVTNGSIALSSAYAEVVVGLLYSSDLETLNIEVPMADGSIQGRPVKIGNVKFRLIHTRGGWIGPNEDSLYEAFSITALAASEQLDDVIGTGNARLFSCDLRVPLGGGYDGGGRLFYRQKDPLPVTIGQIIPEIQSSKQSL